MATEVNQNFFAWSQEETSVRDISQGTSQMFGHGSISFGRFDLESLEWEKWSVFTNDRRHEEFGKFNGLVAKKKAYFEEYFKRIRELKALQQQNQQTELHLEYSGDGSDSSQTGEHEPAADHGVPTESETLVDDSTEQTTAATTVDHEVKCYGYHEDKGLVSASTHSSPAGGPQQIGKQMRESFNGKMGMLKQDATSSKDDPGMVRKIMITPKRTIEKDSRIGPASKLIPKTVKTTSGDVSDRTIVTKGSGSGIPNLTNRMAKPDNNLLLRRPREATGAVVGTSSRSGAIGLRRPSSAASQRPSTRERRPVTRDASRKPAEVASPCRPSTSERRPATRQSALKHADNATPCRPSTSDRRPITKELAPKQCSIASPCRPSTANRRPVTKDSTPNLSNIATPRRPSTADRRAVTKDSTPKQSNISTQHRPSTADRRPISKELAPKLNAASPHRPSSGERHTGTRDMAAKHVDIASMCRPSAVKQCHTIREGALKHADVVTMCRPSTSERRPIVRDGASKHGTAALPSRPSTANRHPIARDVAPKHGLSLRPSTAERHPICRDVEPKHAPPHRPSTAERRPVTRETAVKQTNVANSHRPLTPDRHLTKKSVISTPRQPSTGERRLIAHVSTMKADSKTPIRSRAAPNYSIGAMVTQVTPQKAMTPNVVKCSKLENISYAKEKMEFHVDGKQKSSPWSLPPSEMLASHVRGDQGLENFRKANKKGLQEGVFAHAYKSINVTPQPRSVKTRVPVPPPPPPPPPLRRPYCSEKTMGFHSSPVGGRKPKTSTPHWH